MARAHDAVPVTADLDLGLLLATAETSMPSVVQIRATGTLPADIAGTLIDALDACAAYLAGGALVKVEPERRRIRVLPIQRDEPSGQPGE
jgi:predicted nuclease of predicted toxin-antitoxin system